jgi:transposase-like protein
VIATTNAIESLNARFRRSVKARGHFPDEQAALKHLYLTIVSLDPTGRGRRRWTNRWKAAPNAFDIAFDGRVSAGRKWPYPTNYTARLNRPGPACWAPRRAVVTS